MKPHDLIHLNLRCAAALAGALAGFILVGRYVPGILDDLINHGHNPYDPGWVAVHKIHIVMGSLLIPPVIFGFFVGKKLWIKLSEARKDAALKAALASIFFLSAALAGFVLEYYALTSFGDVCAIQACLG